MVRLIILRLLESYFRHRFLLLAPIALMIGVFGMSYTRAKTVYISRGAMYVAKQSLLNTLTAVTQEGFSWVTPAQQTVNEFKELLQTDAFVRAIIKQTKLEAEVTQSPELLNSLFDTVRGLVWVGTLGDNTILVGAYNSDAEMAQQLAKGLINAYLNWRISNDQQSSLTAQKFFTELIGTYQSQVDGARNELQTYLVAHPPPARGERPPAEQIEIDRLQDNLNKASTRLTTAMQKEEDARLSLNKSESDTRQKYTVIDDPNMPDKQEQSKKAVLMQGVVFVVIGVVLVIVAVVGGALLDRTYRFPLDVRNSLSLPALATVPLIQDKKKRGGKKQGKEARAEAAPEPAAAAPEPASETPAPEAPAPSEPAAGETPPAGEPPAEQGANT